MDWALDVLVGAIGVNLGDGWPYAGFASASAKPRISPSSSFETSSRCMEAPFLELFCGLPFRCGL